MLYGNLLRVNQIDSQIEGLHKDLSNLYAERSMLMNGSHKPPAISAASTKSTLTADALEVYQQISSKWQEFGVNLPVFSQLKNRLQKAHQELLNMEAGNAVLAGKLHIIVVPPQIKLQKAAVQAGLNVKFIDDALKVLAPATNKWQVLVVFNKQLNIYPQDFDVFMEQQEYLYEGRDCRALGVWELLAGGLQDGLWPVAGEWVLLLNNTKDKQILSITKRSNDIVVDVELSDALLGRNYFMPAVALVNTKAKK